MIRLGERMVGEKGLKTVYPFTAIVDQDQAKAALILNAIDPTIGGVLISGPKGSGKSLLAKSFSQVLPEIEHVADCPYRCSPRDPTNMCPKCLSRFEAGEELPVARTPMKFVQAPLSVTEDMLVGSIDFDKVIKEGERSLRPGLLAEANQNILYIDEVNLLPDHITDNILDAASSGWNYVEREGFSVQHPSRFILVGTMNPEEGELRPQILDRFGIYAETENIDDPDLRTLIVGRNEEYASDPTGFASRHIERLEELRARIEGAKRLLTKVQVPKEAFSLVAETCSRLRVDGFRPDIVSVKVARALAAFNGDESVDPQEMSFSLELALGHRTRRSGMLPPPTRTEIRKAISRAKIPFKVRLRVPKPELGNLILVPRQVFDRIMEGALRSYVIGVLVFLLLAASISYFLDTTRVLFTPSPPTPLTILFEVVLGGVAAFIISRIRLRGRKEEVVISSLELPKMTVEAQNRLMPSERSLGAGGSAPSKATYRNGVDTTPDLGPKILKPLDKAPRGQAAVRLGQTGRTLRGGGYSGGRRTKVVTSSSRGRYAWYQTPRGRPREVAIVPTLRAAALRQHGRTTTRPRVLIRPEDIRVKVREYKAPFSIILLVDMSLSMIESVENIVETVYSLHTDIYRRRDRVGLIVFKGSKAFTIQHPTRNLDLVVKKLREVGASDFTPLAAGLFEAWKTLKQEKLRNREAIPHLIVVSDGIANVPLEVPLSPLTRRRYTSEAQADSFDVSRLIAKEGFKVHVVNTKHIESDVRASRIMDEGRRIRMTPTEFLKEVAHITKGNYIGLDPQGDEIGLGTGSGLLRSPFTAPPG
jgi:Mg-chelatase subunit ChlI/Mg-chelatase subunit ChlD